MATGPTLGRYARQYIDGYDLSGDTHKYALKVGTPARDVTGLAASTMEHLFDITKIALNWNAWFNNTLNSGSYNFGKAWQARIVTLVQGIQAAPAIGDPVLCAGKLMLSPDSYDAAVGAALALSFTFDGYDPTVGVNVGIPFGVLLQDNSLQGSTFNANSVDNLASSASGGVGVLHVTAAGGTWALKIQHSTNNSTWADLITFVSNGTTITAELLTVSGTVNRYLRAQGTKTSGNFTGVITFNRG